MKNTPLPFLAPLTVTALILATPSTGAAQEDVMRDVYGFYGSALDVEVATEASGTIRLMRGRRSRIEVAGRAPDGFTSAALGGRGVRRLTLTALGARRADFVVVVPEDVRVRVLWPGTNRSELFGTLSETAMYDWEPTVERPAIETIRPLPPRAPAGASAANDGTPRVVDLLGATRLDRINLRIEPGSFTIEPAHRVETRRAGETLEVGAPLDGDLSIHVPLGDSFTLRLDGRDVVVISDTEVELLCDGVLSQTLADGRRWLTLTPEGCSTEEPAGSRGVTPARRT